MSVIHNEMGPLQLRIPDTLSQNVRAELELHNGQQ